MGAVSRRRVGTGIQEPLLDRTTSECMSSVVRALLRRSQLPYFFYIFTTVENTLRHLVCRFCGTPNNRFLESTIFLANFWKGFFLKGMLLMRTRAAAFDGCESHDEENAVTIQKLETAYPRL